MLVNKIVPGSKKYVVKLNKVLSMLVSYLEEIWGEGSFDRQYVTPPQGTSLQGVVPPNQEEVVPPLGQEVLPPNQEGVPPNISDDVAMGSVGTPI